MDAVDACRLAPREKFFIGLGAFCGAMIGAKLPFVLSDWEGLLERRRLVRQWQDDSVRARGRILWRRARQMDAWRAREDGRFVCRARGSGRRRRSARLFLCRLLLWHADRRCRGESCFRRSTACRVIPRSCTKRRSISARQAFYCGFSGGDFSRPIDQALHSQLPGVSLYHRMDSSRSHNWLAALTGYQWAALVMALLFSWLWIRDAQALRNKPQPVRA